MAKSSSASRTGVLLNELLTREPYRRRWQHRQRGGTSATPINQSAVSRVIADFLWDTGLRADTDASLPRSLKDRVARALGGTSISAETLGWFIDAFDMAEPDAERLWIAHYAEQTSSQTAVANTLVGAQYLPIPQRHRTLAVFEQRTIGLDRRIKRHRTTSAISACDDGLESYPYRLAAGARDVIVLRGGQTRGRQHFPGSTPIVEIALHTPLRSGQVASLDYLVEFDTTSDPAVEYRRVAHRRVDNLDIVVRFAPACAPTTLWWTVWDAHRDGTVLAQEPATLDSDHCAHRFIPHLENAAAGFRWIW